MQLSFKFIDLIQLDKHSNYSHDGMWKKNHNFHFRSRPPDINKKTRSVALSADAEYKMCQT